MSLWKSDLINLINIFSCKTVSIYSILTFLQTHPLTHSRSFYQSPIINFTQTRLSCIPGKLQMCLSPSPLCWERHKLLLPPLLVFLHGVAGLSETTFDFWPLRIFCRMYSCIMCVWSHIFPYNPSLLYSYQGLLVIKIIHNNNSISLDCLMQLHSYEKIICTWCNGTSFWATASNNPPLPLTISQNYTLEDLKPCHVVIPLGLDFGFQLYPGYIFWINEWQHPDYAPTPLIDYYRQAQID